MQGKCVAVRGDVRRQQLRVELGRQSAPERQEQRLVALGRGADDAPGPHNGQHVGDVRGC